MEGGREGGREGGKKGRNGGWEGSYMQYRITPGCAHLIMTVCALPTDLYCDVSFCDLSHVESDSRNHILIELSTLEKESGREGVREGRKEGREEEQKGGREEGRDGGEREGGM